MRPTFIALFIQLLAIATPSAATTVEVTLEHSALDQWSVAYKFPEPVQSILFWQPSYGTRETHWELPDYAYFASDQEIVFSSPQDELVIQHPDILIGFPFGNEFQTQFSNKDTLVWSSVYHAFAALDGDGNDLNFSRLKYSFSSALHEKIWVNNKLISSDDTWTTDVDLKQIESYVYFGSIDPSDLLEDIALIADPMLPSWVRNKLEDEGVFGRYIRYFQDNLYRRIDRPAVFFPYAFSDAEDIPRPEDSDESTNVLISGRVLSRSSAANITIGGKIFQNDLPILNDILDSVLMGHEIVHLWNSDRISHDVDHAWLWEGSAESLTYYAMRDLGIGDEELMNEYRLGNLVKCIEGLTKVHLDNDDDTRIIEDSNFSYGCGFMANYIAAELSTRVQEAPFVGNYEFWSPILEDSYHNGTLVTPRVYLDRLKEIPGSGELAELMSYYLNTQTITQRDAKGRELFDLIRSVDDEDWYCEFENDISIRWPNIDWDSYTSFL